MYQRVLEEEIPSCKRDYNLINSAIRRIKKVYRRISSYTPLPEIDYNDVNYRYAYVYLFSTCHMTVVEECVKELDSVYFNKMMKCDHEKFSVCSLGGGPGSDAFGLLKVALWRNELTEQFRVCFVDLCEGWATTLRYALDAFASSEMKAKRLKIEGCFIQQDLCDTLSPSVVDEIETCDILSLVKVVSVVSNYYKQHPEELENIFNLMKPESWIFFLDNSEGGFYEIVSSAAEDAGLVLAIPPKTAKRSVTNCLNTEHFCTEPLSCTSVCFAVWEKPAYGCSTSSSPSSSFSDEDCDEASLSSSLIQLFLCDDDNNNVYDDGDGGSVYSDDDDDDDNTDYDDDSTDYDDDDDNTDYDDDTDEDNDGGDNNYDDYDDEYYYYDDWQRRRRSLPSFSSYDHINHRNHQHRSCHHHHHDDDNYDAGDYND